MKEKKTFYTNIELIVILLFVVAFINYQVDPFFEYRGPNDETKMVIFGQMYQNHGMAKYLNYNTLITGTSMTENFLSSWFDEKFHIKAIKLPYAGGNTKDFTMLFNNVFQSSNSIKNIYFGLDLYTLQVDPQSTRFPYKNYQVSSNPLWDVEYLLNNNILLSYSYKSFLLKKDRKYQYSRDRLYISEGISYGKDITLATYVRANDNYQGIQEVGISANVSTNLKAIEKYIIEHSNTKFTIFFPPYSILFWDNAKRSNQIFEDIAIYKYVCEQLLKYNNVEIYAFSTSKDVITNLDNYKDYTHYKQDINRYMFECFGTEKYKVTLRDYNQVFDDFKKFVLNYDYESIFN